jgi:hypothetical protein
MRQTLQLLLWQLCSQMLDQPHFLQLPLTLLCERADVPAASVLAPASYAVVLAQKDE